MRASIAAAVFILQRLSSKGEKPPPKKVECLLRLPSIFGKEKRPMQKKGGRGLSPPPRPLTISPAPSSPHLPNKYQCKYPNAQFTITGNGPSISSTGTITGSEKSHFRNCIYHSFFFVFWLGHMFSNDQRERDAAHSMKCSCQNNYIYINVKLVMGSLCL
jgi:hypothetical protein